VSHAETEHTFSPAVRDWGYKQFVAVKQLRDAMFKVGENALVVTADVTVSVDKRFISASDEDPALGGLKSQACFSVYRVMWLFVVIT
jgi:hypothetical protein